MTECIVGIISDTHGLIRPAALDELRGADLIVHAGDIGSQSVMHALLSIAPVTAVRGNSDRGYWTEGLHGAETFEVCGMFFHVLHDLSALDLDPHAAGVRVVISGHSHRPMISEKDGILYLNPGSAGPRRFTLPVTLARIRIRDCRLLPDIIRLEQG